MSYDLGDHSVVGGNVDKFPTFFGNDHGVFDPATTVSVVAFFGRNRDIIGGRWAVDMATHPAKC